MPEASRGAKGDGELAAEIAHQDGAVGKLRDAAQPRAARGCVAGGGHRRHRRRERLRSRRPASSASSRTASAASNQASFGSSSGGGSDASPSPTKMVERKMAPDPVDRGHERADHRLAAEVGAEPEAPDRRAGCRRRSTRRPASASTSRRSPAARAPRPRGTRRETFVAMKSRLAGSFPKSPAGMRPQSPLGHLNCRSDGHAQRIVERSGVN